MDTSPGLLAALLDLLFPATCGGCGAAGTRWCRRCASRIAGPRLVRLPGLPPVLAAGRYTGPLRTALLGYKERGRRDLGAPLAGLLAGLLAEPPGSDGLPAAFRPAARARGPGSGRAGPGRVMRELVLVPAPSRPSAARARGGDHVLRLCRAVEKATGGTPGTTVTSLPLLRLARGTRDSVGLDVAAREANLAGRVHPARRAATARSRVTGLAARPVILVDDVVTTGATLRACRAALAELGIGVRAGLVLCDATPPRYGFSQVRERSLGEYVASGVTRAGTLLPNRDAHYGTGNR